MLSSALCPHATTLYTRVHVQLRCRELSPRAQHLCRFIAQTTPPSPKNPPLDTTLAAELGATTRSLIKSVIYNPCMTDIYMQIECAHFGLFPNAPVLPLHRFYIHHIFALHPSYLCIFTTHTCQLVMDPPSLPSPSLGASILIQTALARDQLSRGLRALSCTDPGLSLSSPRRIWHAILPTHARRS